MQSTVAKQLTGVFLQINRKPDLVGQGATIPMQENHHLTASFLHEIDESSRDISKPSSSISPITMSTVTCLSHPSPSRLIKKIPWPYGQCRVNFEPLTVETDEGLRISRIGFHLVRHVPHP